MHPGAQVPGGAVLGLLAAGSTRDQILADYPYLILDARYERVREGGVIVSQAVLVAIGVDWEGRRQVLAVDPANPESRSSWKDLLLSLKGRGLHGVEFVVANTTFAARATTP